MFYLHKNPGGEIELNFDNMTSKMMQDKVRNCDNTIVITVGQWNIGKRFPPYLQIQPRRTSNTDGYSSDGTRTMLEIEPSVIVRLSVHAYFNELYNNIQVTGAF